MELLLYIATGVIGGLLSGMFGVGGGIIVVPILAMLFTSLHFPPAHIMQIAIGTSLATIIVNSLSSAHAHHRRSNVNWALVRCMAPGGILGAVFATWLASRMHSDGLQLLFAVFECVVARHLWRGQHQDVQAKAVREPVLYALGGVVGMVSSMLGIGGGTLAVPLLIYWTRNLRVAIGTAAALGLPLSLTGALGYVTAGLQVDGLPQPSLGYVYLPAWLGIAISGVFAAPLGVRLAHRLPVGTLRKMLAVVLFVLGVKMGWSLL